ncbi:MAG: hypothetical protein IVW51_19205 [Thermaceae bacterium]|nr:hypothetical protein [Thermaceae bacterium]
MRKPTQAQIDQAGFVKDGAVALFGAISAAFVLVGGILVIWSKVLATDGQELLDLAAVSAADPFAAVAFLILAGVSYALSVWAEQLSEAAVLVVGEAGILGAAFGEEGQVLGAMGGWSVTNVGRFATGLGVLSVGFAAADAAIGRLAGLRNFKLPGGVGGSVPGLGYLTGGNVAAVLALGFGKLSAQFAIQQEIDLSNPAPK